MCEDNTLRECPYCASLVKPQMKMEDRLCLNGGFIQSKPVLPSQPQMASEPIHGFHVNRMARFKTSRYIPMTPSVCERGVAIQDPESQETVDPAMCCESGHRFCRCLSFP